MKEKIINTEKYKCFGFINKSINQQLRENNFDCGYANGYVAIPPNHPLYGKNYDTIDIEIHGGLTYSAPVNANFRRNFESAELLDGEIPDNYWVFGFDTMHFGNSLDNCPRKYVIDEVIRLKEILEIWKLKL